MTSPIIFKLGAQERRMHESSFSELRKMLTEWQIFIVRGHYSIPNNVVVDNVLEYCRDSGIPHKWTPYLNKYYKQVSFLTFINKEDMVMIKLKFGNNAMIGYYEHG